MTDDTQAPPGAPTRILDRLKAREVKLDQIAGKTVKAAASDDGLFEAISFTDGTFLWLDDDNGWHWHGARLFVGLGVLTDAEVAQWEAEEEAERAAAERESDLHTLALLRAKYPEAR